MYLNFKKSILLLCQLTAALFISSCTPTSSEPIPGPDKQGGGMFYGAVLGAGSGAVTGAQLSAGAGPGAWVGAGFGAVYGMISGIGQDLLEEDELQRMEESEYLRGVAWTQEVLQEHYERRLELHPNRDIYPADWFFSGDETKLRKEGVLLAREIGTLTRQRMPWSRIVIASYVTASSSDSAYGKHLGKRRAESIATEFLRAGIEARRVQVQGVILPEPILIDPDDSPSRYRQAIEIIALDR